MKISSGLAPLPFLVDLVILPVHLDCADLGEGVAFQLDGEFERTAHERIGNPLAAHILDDLGILAVLRLVAEIPTGFRFALVFFAFVNRRQRYVQG